MLSMRGDVLFEHPQNDEGLYVQLGRRLAAGGGLGDEAWFQPPGLANALALSFRLGLHSLLWPRVLHAVLGAATCALVFVVARRWTSVRVALLATAIAAVHGVSIQASGQILAPVWIGFLNVAGLALLTREELGWEEALGAGLCFGLSALFSPVILPFLLPAAVWLHRRASRGAVIAAFAVGMLAPPAAVTYRNHERSGELVFVAANGGINFFVGNNEDYRETLSTRPGRQWQELDERPLHVGATTLGRRSSYFYARGLEFVRRHPGDALALYGRKLFLFFGAHEIPRTADLQADRLESPVLRALTGPTGFPLPDGLVIPLALVGAVTLVRRDSLLVAFLAMQALVIAAFFVTARYRAPSIPLFCVLAAIGVARLSDELRRGRRWIALGATSASCIVVAAPLWETRISLASERELFRGIAYMRELASPAAAVPHFQSATRLDPRDARPWFELGNASAALGRDADAEAAWREAARLDPFDPRPLRLLASRRPDAERWCRESLATSRASPKELSFERLCVATACLSDGRFGEGLAMLALTRAWNPRAVVEAEQALLSSVPSQAPIDVVNAVRAEIASARALGR